MASRDIRLKVNASDSEQAIRREFFNLFRKSPIPESELLMNLPLFIKRQDLSCLLFMNELYRKILGIHGVVMEFGVRWGRNLALFQNFRGIYEPFNHNRKIIGFDTFAGFPSTSEKDGQADIMKKGSYSVTDEYEKYLDRVLSYHEQESPIGHMTKFELVKGDASKQIEEYLRKNPETIVALAYFDFDIYEPTASCLSTLKSRVTRGTVIGFDELNVHDYPGETIALSEIFGLDRYRICHSLYSPTQSYIVIE